MADRGLVLVPYLTRALSERSAFVCRSGLVRHGREAQRGWHLGPGRIPLARWCYFQSTGSEVPSSLQRGFDWSHLLHHTNFPGGLIEQDLHDFLRCRTPWHQPQRRVPGTSAHRHCRDRNRGDVATGTVKTKANVMTIGFLGARAIDGLHQFDNMGESAHRDSIVVRF